MKDADLRLQELKPCAFCAAGETSIHETHLPPRMSGPGALITVEVRHWCDKLPGVVAAGFSFRGRDWESVKAQWNTSWWNRRT